MGDWIESRLKHPVNLGDLLYFEPADIYTVRKEERHTSYYYPRTEKTAFLLVEKLDAEYEFIDSDDFDYDELIEIFIRGKDGIIRGIIDENIDGMKGRKYIIDMLINGMPAIVHLLIIPLRGYVYTFDFTELDYFSDDMQMFENNIISDIRNNKNTNTNLSFVEEKDFEARINRGERLDGSLLRFKAQRVVPDVNSILGGYNIWAGEHLNLISEKRPTAKEGDELVVRVLYYCRTLTNSWAVYYENIDDESDLTQKEWADYSVDDIRSLVNKCIAVAMEDETSHPVPSGIVFSNYSNDIKQEHFKSENPLTISLRCFEMDKGPIAGMKVYNVLKKYTQDNKWILFPVKNETNELMVVHIDNKEYAVMFSESQFIKAGEGVDIIATDINKLFDVVIEGGLQGIIINPFCKWSCYLDIDAIKKLRK